jgi:hypothetical protein
LVAMTGAYAWGSPQGRPNAQDSPDAPDALNAREPEAGQPMIPHWRR